MSTSGGKRKIQSPSRPSPSKRVKAVETIDLTEDDDDDDAAIWAQIEAEACIPESSHISASKSHLPAPPVDGEDDDDVAALWAAILAKERQDAGLVESDEAMARRLETEWQAAEPGGSHISKPANALLKIASTLSPENPGDHLEVLDPKEAVSQYKSLFTQVRECSSCSHPVESLQGYVMFGSVLPPPTLLYLLHASCSNCNTNHCRGCFKVIACKPKCKGRNGCPVLDCCAEVRAIALFEALSALDRRYAGSKQELKPSSPKKSAANIGTSGKGGTGYGTGDIGRTRYATSAVSAVKPKVDEPDAYASYDTFVLRGLQVVKALLPDVNSDNIYDMLPHPSIRSLLQLSFLPEILRELLRNDSVNEWTRRSEVYHEMIALLRRLADSELSVELLVSEGWEKKASDGIDEYIWGSGEITFDTVQVSTMSQGGKPSKAENDAVKSETTRTPPLYGLFQKLVRQCEAFLSLSSHSSMVAPTSTDAQTDYSVLQIEELTVQAQALCLNIIQARDDIVRVVDTWSRRRDTTSASTSITSLQKGKNVDPAVIADQEYAKVCERLAFGHTTLSREASNGALSYNHIFSKNITSTASSTRVPRQRLHLIKELSVMATSLPPGIWVRVDEVRNDVIKILIAGPEGTPYSGGLFEFDCFMPIAYPNESPKLNIRTTAGGRVRFNPNLYANGKVCLSLLGTWPGRPEEQWNPAASTLLQVLISIQSMILIDAPYFNEPGHGTTDIEKPASVAYNKNVALQTVRWAMVEWMTDEVRQGLWADVIYSHFTIRRDAIRKQILAWSKQDPRFGVYSETTTRSCGTAIDPNSDLVSHSHPYSHKNYQSASAAKINLLEEFDRRMQHVGRWNLKKTS